MSGLVFVKASSMSDLKRVSGTIALCAGIVAAAAAQQSGEMRLTPADVKWPTGDSPRVGTSGVAGIQTITLKGDPTKPGVYALLLRAGPNTTIRAHAHPDDRVATVVSGTWYFGYGREFDEKSLKTLPAGSFYTEPPGVNHFAMTKTESAVIQITGYGPTGTTYVDPRNDPSKKP